MRKLGRMIVMLIILAVLLWGAINVIGARIPRERAFVRTAPMAQSAETVWDVIIDIERHPEWQKSLKTLEVLSRDGNTVRYRSTMKEGFVLEMEEIIYPDRKQVISTIVNKDLPFGGSWDITVAPAAGGSEVTLKSDGYVDSKFWRFILKYVLGESYWCDLFLTELQARVKAQ